MAYIIVQFFHFCTFFQVLAGVSGPYLPFQAVSSIICHQLQEHSMAKNLLLEVGTEEIPHAILLPTLGQFKENALNSLQSAGIEFGKIFVYGTPRRLALMLTDLENATLRKTSEKKGPAWDKAFQPDGTPSRALEGFLKSSQAQAQDVRKKNMGGNDYAVIEHTTGGEPVEDILPGVLQSVVSGLNFPKTMRWGTGSETFVRPIRWILSLLDKKVLPLSIAGVASDNLSYGHRILSGNKPFRVDNPLEYRNLLKENNVIVDHDERRSLIRDMVDKAAHRLHARALLQENLLDTLVSLTEKPQITVGQFESAYLELPKEVLVSEMIDHQMFIPLENKDGHLINSFLITANISPNENVVKGNERVIRARFSDGRFFYQEDRKTPLADKVQALAAVSFAKGLGSLHDKVLRMQKLTEYISQVLGWEKHLQDSLRAVLLCKADLVTGMVGEFDELQGVMGRYYAAHDKEKEQVAVSIEEHYLPRFSGDSLPRFEEGILASLSDRIDNLFSLYATGKFVTGSKDPYALRRQTLGVIRILIEKKLHLDISAMFDSLLPLYRDFLTIGQPEFKSAILEFITTRIKTVFKEYGFNYDEIEAGITGEVSDIYDSYLRIQAIHDSRQSAGFINLATAFKRVKNIIRDQKPGEVNPDFFQDPSEAALWKTLEKNSAAFTHHLAGREYSKCVAILTSFREDVDTFFEKVMVMDKDTAIRTNRVSLLYRIDSLFNLFIDFDKIVIE